MKASEIETIVYKLMELKKTVSIKEIDAMEEFNEFKKTNKMFYSVILSDEGMDPEIFKNMMKFKRKLEEGADQYSVDVQFGQYMSDKYIAPVLKK